ncbi:MAG: SMI1/KNR4 family protein [Bernardetiaceae bacterium]|jgi:hypothetical protein|nr:SMI1/KNR4 family protein [Bernardetiaceae bacterium]
MQDLALALEELRKLSSSGLQLALPLADKATITAFEQQYQLTLPDDFKALVTKHNGLALGKTRLLALGHSFAGGPALETAHYQQHFEAAFPMFSYLVPFATDGEGHFYCFDTRYLRVDGTCPIVFWETGRQYTEIDLPETVYLGLAAWIEEVLIHWTLEQPNRLGQS